MYLYIYIYIDLLISVFIYIYIFMYLYIFLYLCFYIYIYVYIYIHILYFYILSYDQFLIFDFGGILFYHVFLIFYNELGGFGAERRSLGEHSLTAARRMIQLNPPLPLRRGTGVPDVPDDSQGLLRSEGSAWLRTLCRSCHPRALLDITNS